MWPLGRCGCGWRKSVAREIEEDGGGNAARSASPLFECAVSAASVPWYVWMQRHGSTNEKLKFVQDVQIKCGKGNLNATEAADLQLGGKAVAVIFHLLKERMLKLAC